MFPIKLTFRYKYTHTPSKRSTFERFARQQKLFPIFRDFTIISTRQNKTSQNKRKGWVQTLDSHRTWNILLFWCRARQKRAKCAEVIILLSCTEKLLKNYSFDVFCKSRTTFFCESIDHAGKKCRGWNNHKLMGDNFLLKQLSCQTTFLICRQNFHFQSGPGSFQKSFRQSQ